MPGSPLPGEKPVPTFPEGAPLAAHAQKMPEPFGPGPKVKTIAENLTQRSSGDIPATKRTVSRKHSTHAAAPGYFDGLLEVAL